MGNTHRTQWNDHLIKERIMEVANTFDPVRMPSLSEFEEYYGNTSLSNKICKSGGCYFWADKLGLDIKKIETSIGIKAEQYVSKLLSDIGFNVEMTCMKHPYDLLVNGCVKIDVKSANISFIKDSKVYAYRISKRQHTCDFYIFCEFQDDEIKSTYVVPANIVSNQVQVEMGTGNTKYEIFRDRFDLIEKTVDFYKSLK